MSDSGRQATFEALLRSEEEKLLGCVHCGFCLPACPTYLRLGDEADSPRGRLHLMRALVEGRIDAGAEAFQTHIDRCLGCRACETVCPSGVEYGQLLEGARSAAVGAHGSPWKTRVLLKAFASPALRRPALFAGRVLRATGVAGLAARIIPSVGPLKGSRLALAMLAASSPVRPRLAPGSTGALATTTEARSTDGPVVAVLTGCVQDGLYRRVSHATRRVLEANGCTIRDVPSQGCCGALHAHAGHLDEARALARRNVDAFERAGVDLIALNAAGCGASMREYGHLLATDPDYAERAEALSGKVRDVTEILAELGPRPGAPIPETVTYDAPCHLHHAQRVTEAPLTVLASIPEMRIVPLTGATECCGGAGIYGITHPELGGRIGSDKVDAIEATGADVVLTGNPGCMMQIGAGLRLRGSRVQVAHPVELLDDSYRRAGLY